MLIVPQQKLLERWDTLSENLRLALVSPENGAFVQEACKSEHIPDEKIPAVARVIAYVLYGFLHPEDAPQEIRGVTEINSQIAASIVKKLNTKILLPFKNELDAIYSPVGPTGGFVTPFIAPGLIKEIEEIKAPPPDAQQPKSLESFFSPNASTEPMPIVLPVEPPTEKPKNELDAMPLFLHQESGSAPIAPTGGFRLDLMADAFHDIKPQPDASERLAKLEVGGELSDKPKLVKTEAPQQRIVHYGSLLTPFEEALKAPSIPSGPTLAPKIKPTPQIAQTLLPKEPSPEKPKNGVVFSLDSLAPQPQTKPTSISTKEIVAIPEKKEGGSLLGKLLFWRKNRSAQPSQAPPQEIKIKSLSAPLPQSQNSTGGVVFNLRSLQSPPVNGDSKDSKPSGNAS